MSELKRRHINEVINMFCLTKGDMNWAYVYYADEADKVVAHNKYKRCLAIAGKCRLRARWFGDNAFYKKERWALQWHRRWLKIAEQFKEAS